MILYKEGYTKKKLVESPFFWNPPAKSLSDVLSDERYGVVYDAISHCEPWDIEKQPHFLESRIEFPDRSKCRAPHEYVYGRPAFDLHADGNVPILVYHCVGAHDKIYANDSCGVAREFVRSVTAACKLQNRPVPQYGYLSYDSIQNKSSRGHIEPTYFTFKVPFDRSFSAEDFLDSGAFRISSHLTQPIIKVSQVAELEKTEGKKIFLNTAFTIYLQFTVDRREVRFTLADTDDIVFESWDCTNSELDKPFSYYKELYLKAFDQHLKDANSPEGEDPGDTQWYDHIEFVPHTKTDLDDCKLCASDNATLWNLLATNDWSEVKDNCTDTNYDVTEWTDEDWREYDGCDLTNWLEIGTLYVYCYKYV